MYLDWASAAPVHPKAQEAFLAALKVFGNPSSPHEEGVKAKGLLTEARKAIAKLAGAKARSVIFTSGATEANALAIQGRVKALHSQGTEYKNMHILYLPTMHSSVLKTVEEVATLGVRTQPIPLQGFGIDLSSLATFLTSETMLVCVDAVCGETGTIFDTLAVRRLLDASESKKALLHVDASQLPLIDFIERTHLGADMLVLDAQKIGGVRGIGALIISDRKHMHSLVHGGGQEDGLRPGTEPVALIAAFAEALKVRAEMYATFEKKAMLLRKELLHSLEEHIPGIQINESKHQAPHILNLSFPGLDTDYMVALLDRDGFAVSTKSACETNSEDGSKAVFAYTGDRAHAEATLRISWGPETKASALKKLPSALKEITTFLARR